MQCIIICTQYRDKNVSTSTTEYIARKTCGGPGLQILLEVGKKPSISQLPPSSPNFVRHSSSISNKQIPNCNSSGDNGKSYAALGAQCSGQEARQGAQVK